MDPTPEEAAQIAQSAATVGGAVKTLSDIRFEKLEKRLAQLEQVNAELRQANAELYAYASQSASAQSQPAQAPIAAPASAPTASGGYQAPAPVVDTKAIEAAKAEQDALVEAVKQRMHYTAPKTQAPAPDNSGM